MSNPWESEVPEEYSGKGVELLMETDEEETWAIEVLQTLMAYNVLIATGHIGNISPLSYGHRLPLAFSSTFKTMMFTQPLNFPNNFSIQSGKVDLLQVVGITASELDAAKQTSSEELKQMLVRMTGGLLTSKDRASILLCHWHQTTRCGLSPNLIQWQLSDHCRPFLSH
jgi:Suppressor of fused protein (SUFU)